MVWTRFLELIHFVICCSYGFFAGPMVGRVDFSISFVSNAISFTRDRTVHLSYLNPTELLRKGINSRQPPELPNFQPAKIALVAVS